MMFDGGLSKTLLEFEERFGIEEAYIQYLFDVRLQEGVPKIAIAGADLSGRGDLQVGEDKPGCYVLQSIREPVLGNPSKGLLTAYSMVI